MTETALRAPPHLRVAALHNACYLLASPVAGGWRLDPKGEALPSIALAVADAFTGWLTGQEADVALVNAGLGLLTPAIDQVAGEAAGPDLATPAALFDAYRALGAAGQYEFQRLAGWTRVAKAAGEPG